MMDKINKQKSKQIWVKPVLTVHGNVEQITGQYTYKQFGASDGMTYNGIAIGDVGS
jgi:hypothetical protein